MYEKYSKIPLSIKNNKNLSSNAKLLYGDIQLLCYKNGYCFASNKHLGDILSVTERTITRLLSELEKNNYIKIEYSRNKRKIYFFTEQSLTHFNTLMCYLLCMEVMLRGDITLVVKECFDITVEKENYKMNYFYRMTFGRFKGRQVYGIEVERQDIINGGLVNIERNSVNHISTDKEKVKRLFDLVSKNNVSPIHLIDVIGEYVDEYVSDFN